MGVPVESGREEFCESPGFKLHTPILHHRFLAKREQLELFQATFTSTSRSKSGLKYLTCAMGVPTASRVQVVAFKVQG